MVIGRVSSFKGEDGRIFFNINPEMIYESDDESLSFWNARTAYLTRRRLMAIRETQKKEDYNEADLESLGYTKDESSGAVKARKSYLNYDYSKFQEILDSLVSTQEINENVSSAKKEILSYLTINKIQGGVKYEDIVAEMATKNISQSETDEALNILGAEGEVYEPSLKRYSVM